MDLDGDGRRDILSGSYSLERKDRREDEGMAGLFQVLYGKPDGTFRKAEVVKGTDGEPLIISHDEKSVIEAICTRPFAVDWDGDGHLDLVVGNFAGTFYWFRGEGKGAFQPKPETIKAGDQPLRIKGHHSDPFVIDWDGDGDLDIVSGSSDGGVQWAENVAGAGKLPQLRPFQVLIPPGRSAEDEAVFSREFISEDELTGPSASMRVWVADVNGDGKLDLLVGDAVIVISPAKGLSAAEFKKKFADWKKANANASNIASSETATETERAKARNERNKLYQQRTEFMIAEDTGFVWLYLQK